MSKEFDKNFYNFKKILNIEALTNSIGKSQDYLLATLLAKIFDSLRDITPRFFEEYLGDIINNAVAFGWKACKDLEDLEKLMEKIKEEKEKGKHSNYFT